MRRDGCAFWIAVVVLGAIVGVAFNGGCRASSELPDIQRRLHALEVRVGTAAPAAEAPK